MVLFLYHCPITCSSDNNTLHDVTDSTNSLLSKFAPFSSNTYQLILTVLRNSLGIVPMYPMMISAEHLLTLCHPHGDATGDINVNDLPCNDANFRKYKRCYFYRTS